VLLLLQLASGLLDGPACPTHQAQLAAADWAVRPGARAKLCAPALQASARCLRWARPAAARALRAQRPCPGLLLASRCDYTNRNKNETRNQQIPTKIKRRKT